MSRARTGRPVLRTGRRCAAVLAAGALAACASSAPDLGEALAVAPAGFSSAGPEALPGELCRTTDGEGVPLPDAPTGEPASVGFASQDAQLTAHAWRVGSVEAAAGLVDAVARDAAGCDYDLHFDSDSDGDGDLDSGGTIVQDGGGWDGAGWSGAAVVTEASGDASDYREIRFVRHGDVVVLVTVQDETGDRSAGAVLDAYLGAVAPRLR